MAAMQTDLEKQTKEIYAAISAHDIEKFLSFHTDDCIVEIVATGTVSRGKEEGRASLKRAFAAFPDVKLELISFFTSGNRQCEEAIMSGTHKGEYMGIPATGKSISLRIAYIRESREGKTCRVTQYSDYATLMRQLGVLPAPSQK